MQDESLEVKAARQSGRSFVKLHDHEGNGKDHELHASRLLALDTAGADAVCFVFRFSIVIEAMHK